MSRQVSDQLFIELDYFTPEEYFVYTAEAAASPNGQCSLSCDAELIPGGQIVEAFGTWTVSVTQTATISHIEGADLFAFSDAALAAAVDRIRDTNIAATVAFDIATDGRVYRDISAEIDAALALSADNERSRAFDSQTQAAFSFASSADRIRSTESTLTVAADLTATISHIEGADLVANGFASMTVDAVAVFDNQVQLASSLSSDISISQTFTNNEITLRSAFIPKFSKYTGSGRPRNLTSSATIQSSIKKFGSGAVSGTALHGSTSELLQGNEAPSSVCEANVIPNITDDFILEGWFYPTANENYDLIFFGSKFVRLTFDSDGDLWLRWYKNGSTTATTIYNGSTARTLNTWHHWAIVNNSSSLSLYLDGTRVDNNLHSPGDYWTGYNELTSIFVGTATSSTKYTDEVNFQVGTRLGVDPASSSMTVPTAARTNDPATTVFLYHFDADYTDDVYAIQSAQAALSSDFAIAASITGTQKFASLVASSGTLTASITVLSLVSADIAAEFNQTSVVGKLQSVSSALAVQADISPTVGLKQSAEVLISALNTYSLTVEVFRGFALLAPMAATVAASSEVAYSTAADLASSSQLTADAQVYTIRKVLRGTSKPGPLLNITATGDLDIRGTMVGLRSSTDWPTVIGDINIDSPSYAINNSWMPITQPGFDLEYHNSYGDSEIEQARPKDWLNSVYTINSPGDDGWTTNTFAYPSKSGLSTITPADSYVQERFQGLAVGLFGPGTSGRSIPFGQYESNPSNLDVLSSANSNEFTWSLWFKYDESADVLDKDLWRGRTLMGFWSNYNLGVWPNGDYNLFPTLNVQIDMEGRLEFVTKRINSDDVYDSGGSFRTDIVCGQGANITDGDWHHIVCSGQGYGDGTKTIKLRIDGQDQTVYTNSTSFVNFSYTRSTDFWLLPSANVVKNNPETYNGTQSWWERNLARDPIIISEIFWDDKYVDLDDAAKLAKFYIDETQIPRLDNATDQTPLIYHRGGGSMENFGSLGEFVPGILYYESRSSTNEDYAVITYWNLESVVEFETPPSLVSDTAFTATYSKTTGGESDLTFEFSQQATVYKTVSSDSSLAMSADISSTASPTYRISQTLASSFDLASTIDKIKGAVVNLNSEFTQTTTAVKTVEVLAAVDCQFTQTSAVDRYRSTTAAFEVLHSTVTAAAKNATGTVLLESRFAATAQAQITADQPQSLSSEFSQQATAARTRDLESSITVLGELSCQAERVQPTGADLSISTEMAVSISKITGYSVDLAAAVDQTVTANRLRSTTANQNSAVTLTADNQILRLAQAGLESEFTVLASPRFIVRITAEFTALATTLTVSDVLNIDPYLTLVIKPESRTIVIESETRALRIKQETRDLIIEGYE